MVTKLTAKLGVLRLLLLLVALVLILLSWLLVLGVRRGLVERTFAVEGVPMRLIAPADGTTHPGVLIAHGFGASQQIMLGYAYTLAHAGYATLLWDFGGHAANGGILNREGQGLQQDLDTAYEAMIAQPEVDPGRLALLGHSMGSGAVMEAGIRTPERYQSTVAISPTGAEVTLDRPPNLLLLAGEREPRFAANAETLLAAAGGPNDDFASGTARAFELIPRVEHITILFSPLSHAMAREWLDAGFGLAGSAGSYVDLRIAWYGLHLLGWLLGLVAIAPLLPGTAARQRHSARTLRHLIGLVVAACAASFLLAMTTALIDVTEIGSLLVGGAFALWCLFFGLIWLFVGFHLRWFSFSDVRWGLLLFAVLWLAFGALAQFVWLPWFLIPARLVRWPLLVLAFFPMMWAAGMAHQDLSVGKRALWWLGESVLVMAGLLLAMLLIPGLGVLILVLPLLPLLLGLLTVTGGVFNRAGAVGVGHALFFGWLILAYFPMA